MYSLRYVGFDVMEPHVVHGVRSGLAPERAQAHDEALAAATHYYRERLAHWTQWPTVPFNDSADLEEGVVLRGGHHLQPLHPPSQRRMNPGLHAGSGRAILRAH